MRPGLEISPGQARSKDSSLEHFRQTVQVEMAKQRGKKREGKPEMSNVDNEARVGKPWMSLINRERRFEHFVELFRTK
eukprot:scaffold116767_cov57-Attheya_sp.AAC.4